MHCNYVNQLDHQGLMIERHCHSWTRHEKRIKKQKMLIKLTSFRRLLQAGHQCSRRTPRREQEANCQCSFWSKTNKKKLGRMDAWIIWLALALHPPMWCLKLQLSSKAKFLAGPNGTNRWFIQALSQLRRHFHKLSQNIFRKCCLCNYFIPRHAMREPDVRSSPALHDPHHAVPLPGIHHQLLVLMLLTFLLAHLFLTTIDVNLVFIYFPLNCVRFTCCIPRCFNLPSVKSLWKL